MKIYSVVKWNGENSFRSFFFDNLEKAKNMLEEIAQKYGYDSVEFNGKKDVLHAYKDKICDVWYVEEIYLY